ncbi:similar to Saccharomyces cerevisiae YGR071C Putative protein of unknown function [Maudiozyma barnettii]|uniref:BED-type domain-containing protein n=1 Tax=Maudiozyma barnettii TaxID=61262 RepID=A0A8H2VK61_9SACH|nr:uncharacterized protein KABA2_14S00506 [Kazachstania barnettii]CAB4257276.1 similar to Saccharomyces cerevisiae YGR071C Putative protein of unknown function [Kazachstania barnettii]CAD1784541.1 similar to Saccharomyces cerevisiae YGR071C Putative protein of unknown function [Kazachstania barnettii]
MEVSELTSGLILPPVLQSNRMNQPLSSPRNSQPPSSPVHSAKKHSDANEKRSHKKLVERIKVPEQFQHEVVIDDHGNRWIPVQLIDKTKNRFWSHYLAYRNTVHDVKCKHCRIVIHRLNPITRRPLNLEMINHLMEIHGINKNDDFYQFGNNETGMPQIEQLQNFNKETTTSPSRVDVTDAAADKNTQKCKTSDIVTEDGIENAVNGVKVVADSRMNKKVSKRKRDKHFQMTQILAVIIAAENLPLQFLEDNAVKLLLGKSSNENIPSMFDIMDSVRSISEQIDSLVQRTATRNTLDTQLIVDKFQLSKSKEPIDDQLLVMIKRQLNEVTKMNFFSLTFNVWANSTSILTLQFYDSLSHTIKSLPLAIDRGDPLSKEMGIVTCRSQLLKTIQRIPSLSKSIVSITLPHERLLALSNSDNYDFLQNANTNNKVSPFHDCFVTFLQDIILPLFGNKLPIDNNNNHDNNNNNTNITSNNIFSDNDRENQILDNVIDISSTDPSSNTIFDKINKFYDAIRSNSWELSRFKEIASERLGNTNANAMVYFDRQRYSTASLALETFLEMESYITSVQANLTGIKKFEKSDFLVMAKLYEFLNSFNKIILYYVSGPPTGGLYTLLSMFAIERHLVTLIRQIRLDPILNSIKKVLERVKRNKGLLIQDDMILVSMFMCPIAVFEREILEYTFDSTSLSDIVKIVSKAILARLSPFIDLQEIDSSTIFNEMSQNDGGDTIACDDENDDTMDSMDGQSSNEPRNKQGQAIHLDLPKIISDLLLLSIQEDLYKYLTTVNAIIPKSYLAFCEGTGYVTKNGLVWNHQQSSSIPDEEEGISFGNKDEPINLMEQLIEIKMPVCDAFWQQYLDREDNIITKLLMRIITTQAASSIRQDYSFLKDFKSQLGEEYFEDVIKIKLFNEQFYVGKVDFDIDTLPSACEYN